MPASEDIRDGLGEAFDALQAEFLEGVTVWLRKQSPTQTEFEDVLEIVSKWFFEYSDYRKNFLLEIADDSASLQNAIAEATHVEIVNPHTDETQTFVIIRGDTTPPLGTDVTWKLFCERYARRAQFAPVY